MNPSTLGYFLLAVVAVIILVVFSQPNKSELAPTSQTSSQPSETPAVQDAPVQTAQLSAISPYSGSGRATRSFDGTTFVHAIEAQLSDPAQGKFYEGWLVDKQPSLKFFSTGELLKGEDGLWRLNFSAAQDYSEHKDVVITEETSASGLDGNPEDHVLEGAFE